MLKTLNISEEEILHEIRVSCQIPGLKKALTIRKIIANAAQEANIKVEIAELQRTADNLRLTYNLLKAEDTWAWLEEHHLSLDDFEGIAYTNLLANKLAIHLFGAKVEQFFYENQLNYAAAVAYEVILDDEDLAWELFYALKEKEISFPEIAHQYIENIELRRVGGYQGIKSRTDFKPEIAAPVFSSSPPQILQPIITSTGVHLILVSEIIEPKLDDQLRSKILEYLFTNWLEQKIKELKIVLDVRGFKTQNS